MLEEVYDLLQDILGDPLLADLPEDVDTEDVRCQIARAKGHVIDLTLVRPGDNKMRVSVLHNARVSDLQRIVTKAIKRSTPDLPRAYSWRSLWKRYNLTVGSIKLSDRNKMLVHYGVKNNDLVTFSKRVRVAQTRPQPPSAKRR
ncbi:hypothetical protein ACHWQZ_G018194 [Mnemiopsis leidyi]